MGAAPWDKSLWDDRNSWFKAPTLRGLTDIAVNIAVTAACPALSILTTNMVGLIDDAVFGIMDVAGGYKEWTEVGVEFGKKALSTAASSKISELFKGVDATVGEMTAGLEKTIAKTGLGLTQGTMTNIATSPINSVTYSAKNGLGFDSDAFSKSIQAGLVSGAAQVTQTVTSGLLGNINLKDGNGITLNGHTFDTNSIQKLNNFTGSLAGAGVTYAMTGEATFNALNLADLTGGALKSGLLEMHLGGENGFGMSIGTGGTDVSYGTVSAAMAGLKDAGRVTGAKLAALTGNKESVSTLNSVNMLGWTGNEYEQGLAKVIWEGKLKVIYADMDPNNLGQYEQGTDWITLNKTLLGGG
jgi:hypothetical protein